MVGAFIYTVCVLGVATGYPTGAPLSLCNDAYPHHHGHVRQETASPYSVSVDADMYSPGDSLTVTIRGSEKMKGLQIGAHSVTGRWEDLYGEFTSVPAGTVGFQYYSDVENCVTHTGDFQETRELRLTWRAPNIIVGDLVFTATVVKDFKTFWVNHTAIVRAAQPVPANSLLPTPAMQLGDFETGLNLENCGKNSGCVTYPSDCREKDCDYAVIYNVIGDAVRIRLIHNLAEAGKSYIALGISEDEWMEGDETFTCADVGGSLNLAHGFNPAKYNTKVRSDQLTEVAMQAMDGSLMCEFTRSLKGEIKWYGQEGPVTHKIDYSRGVDSPLNYLYLASGRPYPGSKESVEKHHILPMVSQSKIAFNDFKRHRLSALHDSVKVHITLMVIAWGGVAAVAMVVARFYKDGFIRANEKLCGLASWFQVHRGLATATVLLTIAGFITIFVHYMTFTSREIGHATCGVVVMVLVVVQVVAGMVRPDADAGKKRIVFNWIHRVSGLLTYILAVVTMFIGTNLDYMSDSLKTSGTGLIAAMMALPLLVLVLLQIRSCFTRGGGAEAMQTSSNSMGVQEPDAPKSSFRLSFAVFVVYIAVAAGLVIAFLAVLWSV